MCKDGSVEAVYTLTEWGEHRMREYKEARAEFQFWCQVKELEVILKPELVHDEAFQKEFKDRARAIHNFKLTLYDEGLVPDEK